MPSRRFWAILLIVCAAGLGFTVYERVRGVHRYVLPERDVETERAVQQAAEANTTRLAAMQKPLPPEN